MLTDPIADYLTRIRNAIMAGHRIVEVPSSKMKKEITKILFEKGYILNYKFEDDKFPATIKIALKYHPVSKLSAINLLRELAVRDFANSLVWMNFHECLTDWELQSSAPRKA